jgi:Na+/H+ antiporter NhaD/arsenite permease-like protein
MISLLILVFALGYLGIVLEHKLAIDKSAVAIFTGVVLWSIAALNMSSNSHSSINESLSHHVSDIAGILFFLMGAMTIVELIDAYEGFEIITNQIHTNSKVKLLWIVGLITFFLSSLLDNLTTAIIMVTLCKKIISDKTLRLIFAGIIVIASNAGGAWSPIGDVTTTMLWIGGQISTLPLVSRLFFPSLVSLLVPLICITFQIKGNFITTDPRSENHKSVSNKERKIIFYIGVTGLIFVPIFKTLTHLPPFMGILFSLSVLWIIAEYIQKSKDEEHRSSKSVMNILKRIDMPSILFFLGILLAVAALQQTGILSLAAQWLSKSFQNQNIIVILMGLLSAIVDNVPLVAATMGMYSLEAFPTDHNFWLLLAYCAGTGGSILVIGSAAGVAAMGLEKIEFFWYLKKISWLALIGYFAGIGTYFFQEFIFQ